MVPYGGNAKGGSDDRNAVTAGEARGRQQPNRGRIGRLAVRA
jgi:hypothetical protein